MEVGASLLVAASELKLVQLLRGAMLAADLSGGKVGMPGGTLAPQRNPLVRPREVIDPQPRFEPRHTVELAPRVVRGRDYYTRDCEPRTSVRGCDSASKPRRDLVLAPPWETPVWKIPSQPALVVKVHIHRVDVHNKGSLIDLFL